MISALDYPTDYSLTFESKDGIEYLISRPLFDNHHILVAFTGRQGGVSSEPYSSLNLAFHVGDDTGDVIENRKRICALFNLNHDDLVCAEQVHGNEVALVGEHDAGRGALAFENAIKGADALITSDSMVPLALFFADCTPVVVVDKERRVVGVAHAGWRGIYSDIIEATVESLCRVQSSAKQDLLAFIGPSIGGCCYQVGPDLIEKFGARFSDISGWLNGSCLDLREIAVSQLTKSGLLVDNIYTCNNCCTSCRNETYFSYRADHGVTGRQAAITAVLCADFE